MKRLPDHPNLDHVRQQAKDLRRELRRSRPSATLAEAQKALAEQYGYRDWTDLKAEIDRRRQEAPPATDDAVAVAVARAFGLGTVTAPMVPVERGTFGRIWRLETHVGRWAAKELPPWVGGDEQRDEATLVAAARASGIRTPAIVRGVDGAIIQTIGDTRWRMFEWLKLGPSPTQPAPLPVTAAVGGVLGKLHALALEPEHGISPWLTHRHPTDSWGELRERAAAARAPWLDLLDAALPALIELKDSVPAEAPAGERPVLTHCDLSLSNIRVDRSGVVVLDFAKASALYPSWELGYVLFHWALVPDHTVQADAARAVVDGYCAAGGSAARLGLGAFSAVIAGHLHWTRGRIERALNPAEPEEQAAATRELPELLGNQLTVEHLEALVDTVNAPAVA